MRGGKVRPRCSVCREPAATVAHFGSKGGPWWGEDRCALHAEDPASYRADDTEGGE